jgi:hypothetical protein
MTQLRILVLSIFFISCTSNSVKLREPIRKEGIPKTAFWVGGVDGGNWFDVKSIHSHRNNAIIAVYNDQDGSLIVSKRFIVVCRADKPIWIDDLKNQITGFDGEKIYLQSVDGGRRCWMQ